jgi:hypothetical protein
MVWAWRGRSLLSLRSCVAACVPCARGAFNGKLGQLFGPVELSSRLRGAA